MDVIENVGEHGSGDGQWTRAENAGKETTNHDGLNVEASCRTETEDRETKHANYDWNLATLQFGEWSPDQRSESVSKHKQRSAQCSNFDTHVEIFRERHC